MTNIEYEVGDVIEYVPMNSASTRRVRVIDRCDIEGRPGFDAKYEGSGIRGEIVPQEPVWGYDDQITRNISEERR